MQLGVYTLGVAGGDPAGKPFHPRPNRDKSVGDKGLQYMDLLPRIAKGKEYACIVQVDHPHDLFLGRLLVAIDPSYTHTHTHVQSSGGRLSSSGLFWSDGLSSQAWVRTTLTDKAIGLAYLLTPSYVYRVSCDCAYAMCHIPDSSSFFAAGADGTALGI